MLSIEKCREILKKEAIDMPDEKIKELRDSLYALGEMALDQYFEDLKNGVLDCNYRQNNQKWG
jgi:hypothetical protein